MVEMSPQESPQQVFFLKAEDVIFPSGTNFVTLFINNKPFLFEITSIHETSCFRGILEGEQKMRAELKQLIEGEAYYLFTYPQELEICVTNSGHVCYICTHTGELLPAEYCQHHQFASSETTDLINLQSITAFVDFFNSVSISIMNIIKKIRNSFPKKVF